MSLAVLLTLATAVVPIADVPFNDDFGLVLFEASVNGSEPLVFLLDTGFDVSILDADAAARLGLPTIEVQKEAQPGGEVEVGQLAPVAFSIGDLRLDGVKLVTIPLGGAGAFIGRRFDGILGHDVLERFVVDIDYPQRRLRFLAAENWEHTGAGQILPVEIKANEVFVNAGIMMPGGRSVFGPFKLDTGSIDVAGLNLNFVRESALIGPGTVELRQGGVAVGGETEGRLFRAAAFVVGADRIDSPLIGYTVDSGGFENRADAGTFGTAVLRRYRLILDYRRNRIILEAGPNADGPVPEDRSGMLVVSPGPDYDTLVVAMVTPETPAAEAGLVPGDEIISIDGRTEWTLPDVRLVFEESGPVTLVVRNDDGLREVIIDRRPLLPLF